MNCNDLDRALREEPQLPLQAQEHIKSCSRCQELVLTLITLPPAYSPSPASLRQIAEGLTTDLRPVRQVRSARYFFVAFAGTFVSIVVLSVYRMGAFAVAVMTPLQAAAILSALAIGTVLLAYSLAHQMIPGSRHRISPGLLPIGITISLMIAIAVLFHFQHGRNFWGNAWTCMRAGTPIGILAVLPFWLMLRRGAILSPTVSGAATGLLAGLVGTSVLEIHCPNLDAWHILVSHLGIAMLGALVGLITGLTAEFVSRRSVRRFNHRT